MIKVIYQDGTEQDITTKHTKGKQGDFSLVDRSKDVVMVEHYRDNPSNQQKRWRSEHREKYNAYYNSWRKSKVFKERRLENG